MKPTRAEVLAMEPGRLMDAWVSLLITKAYTSEVVVQMAREGKLEPRKVVNEYGTKEWHMVGPPGHSTNIGAAWQVVEKLSATHWCQVTTPFFHGDQHSARFDLHNHTDATNPLWFARGNTVAEALCKAALLTQCEDAGDLS